MQSERLVLSISQLNNEVAQMLSQGFPSVWVEGEISNFVRASSGHCYFSLKDVGAQVRCTLFKNKAAAVTMNLRNGLTVIARGRVGLYEARGDFQLVLDSMEAAGEGQLQRQFELLKQQLFVRGWFDEQRKQALPRFPRCIGVITSPTGAAIRDIVQVLKRRCPQVPVMVYPVLVQGEGAGAQIIQAFAQAQVNPVCDVLILARGGGAIEDLSAFNEEGVAQAIYHCTLPVVTGVGHEIDFTIADFVADKRAPTPSAAAELVSSDMAACAIQVDRLQAQLLNRYVQLSQQRAVQVKQLEQRLRQQQPLQRLQQQAQRVDELEERLRRAMNGQIMRAEQRCIGVFHRLKQQTPERRLLAYAGRLQDVMQRFDYVRQRVVLQPMMRLQALAARLETVSPLATLSRGYSITRTDAGKLITGTAQVNPRDTVITQVSDGYVVATVQSVRQELF